MMTSTQDSSYFNILTLLKDPVTLRGQCADLSPRVLWREKRRVIAEGIGIKSEDEQNFLNCGRFGHTNDTGSVTHHCNKRCLCPQCGILYSEELGRNHATILEGILEAGWLRAGQPSWLIPAVFTLPKDVTNALVHNDLREIILGQLMKAAAACTTETLKDMISSTVPAGVKSQFGIICVFQGWSKKDPLVSNIHFHLTVLGTFVWRTSKDTEWRVDVIPGRGQCEKPTLEKLMVNWYAAVTRLLDRHGIEVELRVQAPGDRFFVYWPLPLVWRGPHCSDEEGLTYQRNLRAHCRYVTRSPWADVTLEQLEAFSAAEWEIIASHHGRRGFERLRNYGYVSKRSLGEFAPLFNLEKAPKRAQPKQLPAPGVRYEVRDRDAKEITILYPNNYLEKIPRNQVQGEKSGGRSRTRWRLKHEMRVPQESSKA